MSKITQERLKQLFSYDAETGLFTWRVDRRGHARAGSLAGSPEPTGYIKLKVDGECHRAHRLAWLCVHGEWPSGQIDHIDGDKANNRIANLREATVSENRQNLRRAHRDSASGVIGATFDKRRGVWQASITLNRRCKFLGYFDSAEAAGAAYLKAKAELHPFQTIAESVK